MRPGEWDSKDAAYRLLLCPAVSQSQAYQAYHTHTTLPRLSIVSGTVQDRQPNGSHRLGEPEMGLMLSARASRGEQQGEMLIRLQA